MKDNPLLRLEKLGQSIWLDFIRRGQITSGELQKWIDEDGVTGVTSNPSIFEKAIAGSHDYDNAIRVSTLEGKSVEDTYWALAVEDIQSAADLFRPVYERTEGRDGFVSLEVSPHLSRDTQGTIDQARALWKAVDRPNIYIKVPGTSQGVPAIKQLLSEGINVNVTLLFGLPRYREVAKAYVAAMQSRAEKGLPLESVSSVASFFLSRIDLMVDPILEAAMKIDGKKAQAANRLHGQIATASAKIAYQMYKEVFGEQPFKDLAARGARTQRLLWASTSTKNPAYSDVKYVDALIGRDTVNTVPLETLNAYRNHGDPAPRLEQDLDEARQCLTLLPEVGIDIDEITRRLEEEGIDKFNKPYDSLLETLEDRQKAALNQPVDRQEFHIGDYQAVVDKRIGALEKERFSDRLWRKDPTLWKSASADQKIIRNALGWLHVAEKMDENLNALSGFVSEVRKAGFTHVVHMGMGGSSMAPMVFQRSFNRPKDAMTLAVLDTTDPATISRIEREIPLAHTLFIVATKSGTTTEPLAFMDYFFERVKQIKGERAGENFVAITDPDTPLIKLATQREFRKIFLNFPDIGGRYSALSYFGLVPAALSGVDVSELLSRALRMARACDSCVAAGENPGLILGAVMGELAAKGRDKVSFLMPKSMATFGLWLEQLLAESTGKEGTGLLPVAGEPSGKPEVYGGDRLFVYFRTNWDRDAELERGVEELKRAHQPVVAIHMDDMLDLGQEFFRWEIATAVAGSILGINAFNQPNVQESKDNTNRLLSELERTGHLPEEKPALADGVLSFYTDSAGDTPADLVASFLARAHKGDYLAMMAYLTEEPATDRALDKIRVHLRDRLRLAITQGYGPRFLHSTGQYHKGGPNTGVFLQFTADDEGDLPVPGVQYTFGSLKRAQALGDLEALRKHGRRVMRVHLGPDVEKGLLAFDRILDKALA